MDALAANRAASASQATTSLTRRACRRHLHRQPSSRRRSARLGAAAADAASGANDVTLADLEHVARAVELAGESDGLTQPHPKSGCVLVAADGGVVAETFQLGQGGARAEVLAADAANGGAAGGCAYLNLEPVHGNDAGEDAGVNALHRAGVTRVVIGIAHPIPGTRHAAVDALRARGVHVVVLGDDDLDEREEEAKQRGEAARNRALLYRVATGRPFSVLKYAMTVDGKIATTSGHSSWVTGPTARGAVWAERARSDAVVVGGSTVRRDNPNLTTRRKDGHLPARVVLSRTMDLPGPRTNLWDTSEAPTIVMTRTGARPEFQAQLRELGVEVIEFDDLTPSAVAEYCGKRGYLQLFWECGGGLAAPALNDGVIHHVMAFIAPKIIGSSGGPAPSPVGETGLDLMTDAMTLRGLALSTHGRDVLLSGYLPAVNTSEEADPWTEDPIAVVERAASAMRASDAKEVRFYKSWDRYGALSNFSPHSIVAPKSWRGVDAVDGDDEDVEWPTVEHFYQAQKFSGVDAPAARDAMERIRAAASPEEAARIGRTSQKHCPELIRADWAAQKEGVMRAALRAKLSRHDAPRALLVGTKGKDVLEDSPHDAIWGVGRDGGGGNLLGKMLMELRDELTR
ncbi:uncharacterized protein MICPUCDRAFT_15833 [Micromonas pusilla CCMP1545]|uniref:5-amino-6-(5-phosphoribosylamino)uracil reductase n=1 Tax=Micromonas pusilla (strain CCMP1545) TaxID=564608 RepID=C1MQV4_MICPC|nr:uncharacterized protein MICPUCDRAFT_15833 [Micromonas pusilla CCMP1545]EEH58146.1 predicted protein [Micromonas pusilla CCMP1545]|eukprot:XP_003058195.1 predicted protein [Micromonas pusilla CCMP1545]